MAYVRVCVPRAAAIAVTIWWLSTNTVSTLGVLGFTTAFFAAERLMGIGPRAGQGDDLVHLMLTTAIVRFTGVQLIVGALHGIRSGPTVTDLPIAARLVVVVTMFDLMRYAHHRPMHESSLLEPVHRVQHRIERVDVLIKARRHPLDDVILIVLFGVMGFAMGVHQLSLRAVAVVATLHGLVVHSNFVVRPLAIDRFVVTPWIHHRHHRIEGEHADYGGLLSVWDSLFGSRRHRCAGPARCRRRSRTDR